MKTLVLNGSPKRERSDIMHITRAFLDGIFLVQHDDHWNEYYKGIESTITDLLADYPVRRISHIGSTAIQGMQFIRWNEK